MNVKARRTKKQVNVENWAINLLPKEELSKKIEVVEKELRSYTWRDLETNGKFAKNDKLSFITDDMLIVGCDIGSETHYISHSSSTLPAGLHNRIKDSPDIFPLTYTGSA